jgi:hypothetical protein
VLASADDIDIIGRKTRAVTETFLKLEKAAQEIVLTVNESKTKHRNNAKQIICGT